MKCPATMCPLFAKDGSPWTGNKNSDCHKEACAFYHKGNCQARSFALEQVDEVCRESYVFQIGMSPKFHKRKPMQYDCKKASECQWQLESGDSLCPPREALARGRDPRVVAY